MTLTLSRGGLLTSLHVVAGHEVGLGRIVGGVFRILVVVKQGIVAIYISVRLLYLLLGVGRGEGRGGGRSDDGGGVIQPRIKRGIGDGVRSVRCRYRSLVVERTAPIVRSRIEIGLRLERCEGRGDV